MRLWSLHPCYLDSRGLVALWREALLAQQVLAGLTRGYRFHPQLIRFREHPDPLSAIGFYLGAVQEEAGRRGYNFRREKIRCLPAELSLLAVTSGQLAYELYHLRQKLARRDPAWHEKIKKVDHPLPHPLFQVVPGKVEEWEKIY
ncbi:pyrimidine dimer DNA glycosylase/endonuclease V [Desulfurispora thermophila]|uniref:pyrimidine dimer DNA glycosylase/endonuclease V n=1 Tax=Desulfurispora thermophila TaxID=265470 RepID=UPI00037931A1|nr:pyrimidine dimer DNA glycosylase/endonuclease V [Desulfurispora thermophila]